MRSTGLVAPLLAAGAAARYHARDVEILAPRAIVDVDPNGAICPAFQTVSVIVQPIFYSEFIPYNTVIDPFRNGQPLTVLNAPTPVVVLSDFRNTFYSGYTIPSTSMSASSTASSTGASTDSTMSSMSSSETTSMSTTFETTSSVSSSTSAPSSTITSAPVLNLGDGFPDGVVTDLQDDFLVLGFTALARQPAKRAIQRRQQVGVTALPAVVVNLIDGDNTNSQDVPAEECDFATPLILDTGKLVSYDRAIAKQNGATEAVVGFLVNEGVNAVNASIRFVDGRLNWFAADGTGNANFLSCPNGLYAGFPNFQADGCTEVLAGAIGSQACINLVTALGRQVNPGFRYPRDDVTSSTMSSSTATESTSSMTESSTETTSTETTSTEATSTEPTSAETTSEESTSTEPTSATETTAETTSAETTSAETTSATETTAETTSATETTAETSSSASE